MTKNVHSSVNVLHNSQRREKNSDRNKTPRGHTVGDLEYFFFFFFSCLLFCTNPAFAIVTNVPAGTCASFGPSGGVLFFRKACIRRVSSTLLSCHGGTNVLCARVCPRAPGIVASGGADKSLLVSGSKTGDDDDSLLLRPRARINHIITQKSDRLRVYVRKIVTSLSCCRYVSTRYSGGTFLCNDCRQICVCVRWSEGFFKRNYHHHRP